MAGIKESIRNTYAKLTPTERAVAGVSAVVIFAAGFGGGAIARGSNGHEHRPPGIAVGTGTPTPSEAAGLPSPITPTTAVNPEQSMSSAPSIPAFPSESSPTPEEELLSDINKFVTDTTGFILNKYDNEPLSFYFGRDKLPSEANTSARQIRINPSGRETNVRMYFLETTTALTQSDQQPDVNTSSRIYVGVHDGPYISGTHPIKNYILTKEPNGWEIQTTTIANDRLVQTALSLNTGSSSEDVNKFKKAFQSMQSLEQDAEKQKSFS